MASIKRRRRKIGGLIAALLMFAATVLLFTCETVPDFCGNGETYDPGCQFCFGGTAHNKCGGVGGKDYNPFLQGCVDVNDVEIGTRCQDYSVVPKGTPCGGWTLTTAATPAAGGDVERAPDEPNYKHRMSVVLTPKVNDGYEFVGWAGELDSATSAGDTKIIPMNKNKPIVAMFKHIDKNNTDPRALITTAFPENGGTVTAAPSKDLYSVGEEVTVTAAENPGYEFAGWSGSTASAKNTVTLKMNNSQTLVAVFRPKVKKITVSAIPGDGGAVYVNGAALNGVANQDAGTEIVAWARAAAGWTFVNWSGSPSAEGNTDNPALIPVTDNDMAITANFRQGPGGTEPTRPPAATFTLDVQASGGGSVSLSANDPDNAGYTIGTRVTATAIPEPGYKLGRWAGAASGTRNPVTITMNENKTLIATFIDENSAGGDEDSIPAGNAYTLSTIANPSNGGSVTRSPNKTTFTLNETVTVTAAPASGFAFDGWSGSATGTANPMTITMNGNKTLTANFKSTGGTTPAYTITFDPNGGTLSAKTAATVNGKLASLPAPARDGYVFEGWFTGTTGGTKVTTATTFNEDKTIYAQWTPIYTIEFDADGGSVSPLSAKTGTGGKLASLPTPAKAGYALDGWYTEPEGGGIKVTISTVFNEDATIYARWKKITFSVTFNAGVGTVSPASMYVGEDGRLDELPEPKSSNYIFVGWYTSAVGGTEIDADKVYTANTAIYAHWVSASSSGLVFDLDDYKKGALYTGGWYAYTWTDGSGGTVSVDPDPANVNDYSTLFANANGRVILKASGIYGNSSGAGLGIMWFDEDGSPRNMDISGYTGVYITYSLTSNAPVYMQIVSDQVDSPDEDKTLTEYDEYRTEMTSASSSRRAGFKFSDFKQTGWGTRVPLSTVLNKSHGFAFQITESGTATLTITRVELYK
jgi:uncharacterized repeat protein (TIGR02543 family)